MRENAISCIGCGRCSLVCGRDIAIPEYFRLYNEYTGGAQVSEEGKSAYREAANGRGLASDCIYCGSCESRCPQRIEVTLWLMRVAEAFE